MAWKGPTGPTPPILPASKPLTWSQDANSCLRHLRGRAFHGASGEDFHGAATSTVATPREAHGTRLAFAPAEPRPMDGWALLDGARVWDWDLVWFGQRPDWGTVCASSRRDSSLVAVEGLITHFHWLEEFRRETTTPMTPMPKRTFQCFCFFLNGFYLMFFPTCQVRVVRFYVSCLLLLSSPLLISSPPPRRPPRRPPRPTATRDPQCSLSDLNHDHPRPVCPAGPQPRPSTPSVPCRTSTVSIRAQCSLPDLNHDHPRPVFPAGPQPRVSPPSVPCRTSTTTIHAQCSLPDLNREYPRQVFPAGPHVGRYAR